MSVPAVGTCGQRMHSMRPACLLAQIRPFIAKQGCVRPPATRPGSPPAQQARLVTSPPPAPPAPHPHTCTISSRMSSPFFSRKMRRSCAPLGCSLVVSWLSATAMRCLPAGWLDCMTYRICPRMRLPSLSCRRWGGVWQAR